MKKRSIRFQMMVVLALLLVIMVVFSQILYLYFERQYSAKLLQINADLAMQLAENMNRQYVSLTDAIASFSVNATVNHFLSTTSELEKLSLMPLYDNLKQAYKQMSPGLYSIVLKKQDGSIFSDAAATMINVADTQPAFDNMEEGEKSYLIVSYGKPYIALCQDVYQMGAIRKKIGSVMFVVTAETFMGNLSAASSKSREIFVLSKEGRVIANSSGFEPGAFLENEYADYKNVDQNQNNEVSDHQFIAVSNMILSTGWTILCITPKKIIFSELNGIKLQTYLLLGSMLLLICAVYTMQQVRLSRSFGKLITHIDAIAAGEQVGSLKLNQMAEFHQLASAFNRMMCELAISNENSLEYHEKLLIQQIENKQSQLLALQSQINPHFLYNTLECINSIGTIYGSREVEEMSTSLAAIFRYSIKGDNVVPLRSELEALQYYITIQQIRFPDFFIVDYDISDALLERRILKFLLQPLVENSISHGFKSCSPPCTIHIGVYETSGSLQIIIRDNGCGIGAEALIKLREELKHPPEQNARIGLMNIQRRIRIYYGEKYGLEINSMLGEGTTIVLCLPIVNQEDGEEKQHV